MSLTGSLVLQGFHENGTMQVAALLEQILVEPEEPVVKLEQRVVPLMLQQWADD